MGLWLWLFVAFLVVLGTLRLALVVRSAQRRRRAQQATFLGRIRPIPWGALLSLLAVAWILVEPGSSPLGSRILGAAAWAYYGVAALLAWWRGAWILDTGLELESGFQPWSRVRACRVVARPMGEALETELAFGVGKPMVLRQALTRAGAEAARRALAERQAPVGLPMP